MSKVIAKQEAEYLLVSIQTYADQWPEAHLALFHGRDYVNGLLPDSLKITGTPVTDLFKAWNPDLTGTFGVELGKLPKQQRFKITMTIEEVD